MSAAVLAMQGAIVATLDGNDAVAALIAGRIHDRVPPSATMPYVAFGPAQDTADDADCWTGSEVFQQIDVWSREVGGIECKRIGAAVKAALHNAEVSHDGLSFTIVFRFATYTTAPDGLTSHGVLSFAATIDTLTS